MDDEVQVSLTSLVKADEGQCGQVACMYLE